MTDKRLVILIEGFFAVLALAGAIALLYQNKDAAAAGLTGLAGLAVGNLNPGPLHPAARASVRVNRIPATDKDTP